MFSLRLPFAVDAFAVDAFAVDAFAVDAFAVDAFAVDASGFLPANVFFFCAVFFLFFTLGSFLALEVFPDGFSGKTLSPFLQDDFNYLMYF